MTSLDPKFVKRWLAEGKPLSGLKAKRDWGMADWPQELRKDAPDASDVHVPAPLGTAGTKRKKRPKKRRPGANIRIIKAQQRGRLPFANAKREKELYGVIRRQLKLLGLPADATIDRAISGNRTAYESALKWSRWETGFTKALSEVLLATVAEEAQARMKDQPLAKAASMGITFDARSPAVLRWASKHSAELVRSISDEARGAIRAVVTRMHESGVPPRDAVPLVRQALGENALFPRWAQAVANLGIRLYGQGRSVSEVKAMTGAYYERLADARASTIARTEIIAAQNEGRAQGWQQLVDAGVLDKTKLAKQWDASHEGVCPICDALDGDVVALDGLFSVGVPRPPAHPNCRCVVLLVRR